MSAPERVERDAPAKVNLCLAVDRPNDAGMHPIASWMATLDFADRIEVHRRPPGRASLYNIDWAEDAPRRTHIDWPIVKDLAVRAHLALEREVGQALPVRMRVHKRVPVGSGLGGGSSDGAAALMAIRDLFELEIDDARLAQLAHALGSDVPFFLTGGAALVEGLGERIERTPAPTMGGEAGAVVLAMPAAHCPTGAVYRGFDEMVGEADFRAAEAARMARAGEIEPDALFNDLADPAMRVEDRVRAARNALAEATGRPAHVTGSGSAVFIACAASEAEALGERAASIEGCAVVAARLVTPE
ncbi:MAG: 4-(cytidine 5'-diphospho)-2-C-methyl-D-erythritol kinase [Phycisphaerales bacterium]